MEKKRGKKDAEDTPATLDKTQILQEAKEVFNATSASPAKLIAILTKCVYIIHRGETFSQKEATDLFFHITRLFQYKEKNSILRRLTYISIKSLSKQAENVYVVTSILTSDVNSTQHDPAVRASALRTLCRISDSSTFTSIERYVKQSIVDKHPVVASAAISSLIRIAKVNTEIVRRCTNEIQEALNSDSPMVQYHALGLRYNTSRNDRLSLSRLISNCIQQGLKSPLAICLLIKIIVNYINDYESEDSKPYRDYIRNQMNQRSEMVEFEAANALISLKSGTPDSRRAAVSHLKNFLTSSKPALRFAAVRSLNKLAITAPGEVRECNLSLESLISQTDCNRSIAILAITTLLKTGTESSVERFLDQIKDFLSEIDDNFKVIVVGSVLQLSQRYPNKHRSMMDFLSRMLTQEGGYAYKKSIVDTITKIIEENEAAKERGLEQLCEFIEDCEHESLVVDVLDLLGREGPKSCRASTYIRFITNRCTLDSPTIAAAATSALAKFGVAPELADTIHVSLDRITYHEDYEVSDFAVFYKNILNDTSLASKFVTIPPPKISFADLESKLISYLSGDCSRPFMISSVAPIGSQDAIMHQTMDETNRDEEIEDSGERADNDHIARPAESFPYLPPDVFEEFDLGEVIIASEPTPLSDAVSEITVRCITHIYKKHIVFQFDCTNTVKSMLLENLYIQMSASDNFNIVASTECPNLAFGETAFIYTLVEISGTDEEAHFTNIFLKFSYRIVDPETSEPIDDTLNEEEEYPLEDLSVDLSERLE